MTPTTAQDRVGDLPAQRTEPGAVEFVRRGDWHTAPMAEHAEAVAFVESIHYAKGAPNTSVARHGLYDKAGVLCGVALWLPPTKVAALSVSEDHRGGALAVAALCRRERANQRRELRLHAAATQAQVEVRLLPGDRRARAKDRLMTPWEKRGWPRTIANTVAVTLALVPIVLVAVLVR